MISADMQVFGTHVLWQLVWLTLNLLQQPFSYRHFSNQKIEQQDSLTIRSSLKKKSFPEYPRNDFLKINSFKDKSKRKVKEPSHELVILKSIISGTKHFQQFLLLVLFHLLSQSHYLPSKLMQLNKKVFD